MEAAGSAGVAVNSEIGVMSASESMQGEVQVAKPEVVSDWEDELDEEEDSDGSGDELEVEEREWQGETYAVDPDTNAIYDTESGEVIGVWDDETGPSTHTPPTTYFAEEDDE